MSWTQTQKYLVIPRLDRGTQERLAPQREWKHLGLVSIVSALNAGMIDSTKNALIPPEAKDVMIALYAEHPAMFRNNPLGFILALLLVPVGVGLLILLWWYLTVKAEKLVVTERDIVFVKGLLHKEHSEINIDSIRTVKVRQSFFNRIFGTGEIALYTAGDTPEIVARGMPSPGRVRELINARQNATR